MSNWPENAFWQRCPSQEPFYHLKSYLNPKSITSREAENEIDDFLPLDVKFRSNGINHTEGHQDGIKSERWNMWTRLQQNQTKMLESKTT